MVQEIEGGFNKNKFYYRLFFIFIFLFDRIMKLISYYDKYMHDEINFYNFNISSCCHINEGIFKNYLSHNQVILFLLSIFTTYSIILFLKSGRKSNSLRIIGYYFTCAGFFSNFIDKIIYGGVIDYWLLKISSFSRESVLDPTLIYQNGSLLELYFNLPDIMIIIGLIFEFLFG